MHRDRSLAIGLAAGGVVGGHALAYLLAYPLAVVRATHLAETGHREFSLVVVVGLLGAAIALVATFLGAARRDGVAPRAGTLLRLQLGIFLGLELLERGFDLRATLSDPGVLLGLSLLTVLSVALAWLARGVAAIGRRFAASSARPRRPPSMPLPPREAEPAAPDPVALGPRRAPPSPAVA